MTGTEVSMAERVGIMTGPWKSEVTSRWSAKVPADLGVPGRHCQVRKEPAALPSRRGRSRGRGRKCEVPCGS